MLKKILSRKIITSIVGCFILFGLLGFIIIIKPNNPLVRMFRADISNLNSDLVVGPYPLKQDFIALEQNDIKTIVSLLNPAIPYENVLLEQEKDLAGKHGIAVKNFPLTSIMGQKLGSDYEKNAKEAASFIDSSDDKIYIHCYLGVHRANYVLSLTDKSVARLGEHKGRDKTWDKQYKEALKLYKELKYHESLKILLDIPEVDQKSQILMGWAYYKTNRPDIAKRYFRVVAGNDPTNKDALNGLGYCELLENNLKESERYFNLAIGVDANDFDSLLGIGTCLYRQSKFQEARSFLEKALAIDPANPDAKRLLDKMPAK